MTRHALLADLAARINTIRPDPPTTVPGVTAMAAATTAVRRPGAAVLVGVDGVDGAGKTVFADELAVALRALGRPVIRAGIDSFHHPRTVRYRRGRGSPEGYYRDSFDLDLVRRVLLDPLSAGGSGRYRSAAFDHVTDRPAPVVERTAPAGAVLVFDGVFTHRPELRPYWHHSIFLRVGFDVARARCHERDGTPPDGVGDRYVDGQRLYLAECDPPRAATVVVDNTDLSAPYVVRGGATDPVPGAATGVSVLDARM